MIREALAAAARHESLGGVLSRTPVARDVVSRLVGGDTVEDVVEVVRDLADRGFLVSVERTSSTADAEDVDLGLEYVALIDALDASGLASVSEVSLLPEAFGSAEPVARLSTVARRASGAGIAVMLGHGPDSDPSLAVECHDRLREEGLVVGVTLPAAVRSTERMCGSAGSMRVRLVKGGRGGRGPQSYSQPIEIDKAYVRCAKALMSAGSEASFATHDARLIEILESLAVRFGRRESSYEYTFFMGRQEAIQERLLAQGHQVRVYVPYGPQWFERLVGGLAEQPSSITAAVRSLLPGAS